MQSKELENYIEFLLVWSLLRFGMPARIALRKLRRAGCAARIALRGLRGDAYNRICFYGLSAISVK